MRALFGATLLLALMGATEVAFAQSAADAAKGWGLLGVWRRDNFDCAGPGSRQSTLFTYFVRDGKLFQDRDFGDARDSNLVPQAVVRDGLLELTVVYASLSRSGVFALVKHVDGRIRTTYSYDAASKEYSIRDGRYTVNGSEAPWQKRCR